MFKNMHNPTSIDENALGMAWEITKFQMEFLEMICFISSIVHQNFFNSSWLNWIDYIFLGQTKTYKAMKSRNLYSNLKSKQKIHGDCGKFSNRH